jgi:F0F1-type ATP synthase assembly protein I
VKGQPNDDQQDDRSRTTQRQGAAYQGAFEAVFAILIAAGLGYWADDHFDTSPLLLILGTVLGFAAFVLRLVRLGREMQNDPPSDGH